jgi:multiple sugar transport system substrate-binding protein
MNTKKIPVILGTAVLAVTLTACGGTPSSPGSSAASGGTVTLEFAQWWEPEMPAGALRGIMDQFEAANPGIKVTLLSGPFADTQQQVVAGAAAGTLSDVVGLDGSWVSDLVKQGAITDLSTLMTQNGYDPAQLASTVTGTNGDTYMIPVVNFVYPMFVNNTLLNQAGVTTPPSTRGDFEADAKAVTNADQNVYGWVLPLDLTVANGIQNDVMSWVWASGGSMMKNGKPYLQGNQDVADALQFIQQMYNEQVIMPGALSMQEQDKVNNFTNGRVAMMIDSLAHITMIRQSNPNLDFSVIPIPAADSYTGKRGIPYASWGIGIADNSPHKAEAWKLVQYLMSPQVNAQMAQTANAFPNNNQAKPDYSSADPVFQQAYALYQQQTPVNEFQGLPTADDLMRTFDEQLQLTLDKGQSIDVTLTNAQQAWDKDFAS